MIVEVIKKKTKFAAFLILFSIAAVGCQPGSFTNKAQKGPMLAVLSTGGYKKGIYCIDINSMKLTSKIKLRSTCYDFVLGDDGELYTSQGGGVGSDADDAVGVVDLKKMKVERYIKLKNPAPWEIGYENGKIVVITDIVRKGNVSVGGIVRNSNINVGEIIDVNDGYKSVEITVPGITNGSSLAINNGIFYETIDIDTIVDNVDVGTDEAVFAFDIASKKSEILFTDTYFYSILFDDEGMGYGLVSGDYQGPISEEEGLIPVNQRVDKNKSQVDQVVIFDPKKKTVIRTIDLPIQPMPIGRMILDDDRLYFTYFTEADLSYTGDTIGIFDLKTDKFETIKGFDGPSVILAAEDKIFVANYDTGIIDALDKKTKKKIGSVKVGGWPRDMAYFDNRDS